MIDEMPPQFGQPISMERPSSDPAAQAERQAAAVRMVSEQSVILNADTSDPSAPVEGVSDSDLRRAIETKNLEALAKNTEPMIASNEATLTELNEHIAQMKPFDRAVDAVWSRVVGIQSSKDRAAEKSAKIAEMRGKLDAVRQAAEASQQTLLDPLNAGVLERVVEQVATEAEIIQRIAIGRAIRDKFGSDGLENPEIVRQCVDLYNQGGMPIEASDYDVAIREYGSFVSQMKIAMNGSPSRDRLATTVDSFFDPVNQVKAAK